MPGNVHGIQVNANNVDIDMKGFLLTGAGGGTYGLISGYGESRFHGGVINRFRNSGIYLRNNAWVIKDMQIVRNGGMGIDLTTRFITVENSLVAANGGNGISVGTNSVIRNSTVSSNGNIGIDCLGTCHIEGNAIDRNAFYGVRTSTGMIIDNTISGNADLGILEFTPIDTGIANNTLLNNNPNGSEQIFGGIDLDPNACAGKPC